MERLLARLERRLGRFAIPNLMYWVAGLSGVVFVLQLFKPSFTRALYFDPNLVVHQLQLWRIFTFLFIPTTDSVLWFVFATMFTVFIGNSLEESWGSFKLNVYYGLGALLTVASAFVLGIGTSNMFLNLSLFLAFATLFPDYEIRLYFLVPVKAKWLGLFDVALLAYLAIESSTVGRVAIAVAFGNYLLFFTGHLLRLVRGEATVIVRAKKRSEFVEGPREVREKVTRKCVLCGLSDGDDGADLRVCTCKEVCGGKPTVYCLPHARSHNVKS